MTLSKRRARRVEGWQSTMGMLAHLRNARMNYMGESNAGPHKVTFWDSSKVFEICMFGFMFLCL